MMSAWLFGGLHSSVRCTSEIRDQKSRWTPENIHLGNYLHEELKLHQQLSRQSHQSSMVLQSPPPVTPRSPVSEEGTAAPISLNPGNDDDDFPDPPAPAFATMPRNQFGFFGTS